MKLKMIAAISTLLTITMLSGCASTVNLSQANREMITAVSVRDEVKVPEEMYYFGTGQNVALMFGPIGGIIAGITARKPAEEIALFARENGIFIEEIVQEEFVHQLANSGKFAVSKDTAGDAELEMDVQMYGLSIPNGFSSKFIPVLMVEARLLNVGGDILWKNRKYIFGSKLDGYTIDELKENPEYLRSSWHSAAKLVAEDLVDKL